MSISKTANVQTEDRNQNQSQSNIITNLQVLLTNPIVNFNLVNDGLDVLVNNPTTTFHQGLPLINGLTKVLHGLGRKPLGWFITRQRAPGNIYDQQDDASNMSPETELWIVCDAAIYVDIYIF